MVVGRHLFLPDPLEELPPGLLSPYINETALETSKAQLQCGLKVLLVRTATVLEPDYKKLFRRYAVRFESSFRGVCRRTPEHGPVGPVCESTESPHGSCGTSLGSYATKVASHVVAHSRQL